MGGWGIRLPKATPTANTTSNGKTWRPVYNNSEKLCRRLSKIGEWSKRQGKHNDIIRMGVSQLASPSDIDFDYVRQFGWREGKWKRVASNVGLLSISKKRTAIASLEWPTKCELESRHTSFNHSVTPASGATPTFLDGRFRVETPESRNDWKF
uniref:Uncharacterized protein n=1 Tax=Pristionchus pacificus TaxID=54126 RepID=A0A2A6BZL8_PRIPA|eukprot:PDM71296.1 hypothetical protein PRIPAC_37703 [Pristionchus pacificus]